MIRQRLASTLILGLWLSGCAIGPHQLTSSRLAYNKAVQFTEQRELLLNIVRLRYHATPQFMTINGIASQFEWNASLAINIALDGEGEFTSILPKAELGFAARPTITFTPQQGSEFTRQLIAPVGLETLYRLIQYGWGLERIFDLAVRQINDVGTRTGVAREAAAVTAAAKLRRIISMLGRWQRQGLLTLSLRPQFVPVSPRIPANQVTGSDFIAAAKNGYRLLPKGGGYVLADKTFHLRLKIDDALAGTPEWTSLARTLGVSPNRQNYAIDPATARGSRKSRPAATFYLATRSPLGIMASLSRGVTVPTSDLQNGVAAAVEAPAPITSYFNIATAADQPSNAYLAVPFRGHWFYMQAGDLASRRTLGALISLLRMELKAGGAENVPILTLPVGA